MKRVFTALGGLLILCIIALSLQSCGEEKYTVWTDTDAYSTYQATGVTLEDGYYKRVEITNSQWETIAKELTSEGKHRWTEAEIKKWLIGNGFGEYEATKESSWFAMVNHGMIITRSGNLVYAILK